MTDWEVSCWEAFTVGQFGLENDEPELFVISQWQERQACLRQFYVVFRVIVAIIWPVALLLTFITDSGSYDPRIGAVMWFAYFRHWALIVLSVDVVFQASTALTAYKNSDGLSLPYPERMMPVHLKVQWTISNIALGSGLFATVTEGMIFYSGNLMEQPLDILLLLVNSVYLIANLLLSAMPIRMLHALHTVCYVLFYFGIATTIDYTTKLVPHPMVDWKDPLFSSLYVAVGILMGIMVLWIIIYGIYHLRMLCAGQTKKERASSGAYNPYL